MTTEANIKEKEIKAILIHVRTREEQQLVHEAVGELERHISGRSRDGFEKVIAERLPEHTGRALREVLDSGQYEKNQEGLKVFLASLRRAVSTMRVLTLDLAFEPSEGITKAISLWVADNVGEDVVLEYIYAPDIVGGARIMFEGKYFESTLAQKLSEIFEKEGKQILSLKP